MQQDTSISQLNREAFKHQLFNRYTGDDINDDELINFLNALQSMNRNVNNLFNCTAPLSERHITRTLQYKKRPNFSKSSVGRRIQAVERLQQKLENRKIE
jgi:hypothetical protein